MTLLAQIDENWLHAMVEDINNWAITISDTIKGAKVLSEKKVEFEYILYKKWK